MIQVWALAISLGLPSATVIPGIASQAACQALMQQLAADPRWVLGTMACYSYPAPGLALGAPVGGGTPNETLYIDANGNLAQRDVLIPSPN